MADKTKKFADNVPGKFYVDDQCSACDLCSDTAPETFKRHDSGGYNFVHQQPATPDQEARCQEALDGCPVQAIGNDGV